MGANSKIEWCDHTFNPWIGCTRVSDGCTHCYAEAMAARFHQAEWGPKALRRRTSPNNWLDPVKWNRKAREKGTRPRVFCASMADVFDDHPSILTEWRRELFELIAITPNLDWLLLTKRPQMWPAFLPLIDPGERFAHVRLGVTIEHDKTRRERDELLCIASNLGWPTFISYEPALGPVDWSFLHHLSDTWLIAGGESGRDARPAHPDWFRQARDACAAAGIPFFFKQWGEWHPYRPEAGGDLGGDVRRGKVTVVHPTGETKVQIFERTGGRNTVPGTRYMVRLGKAAGRLLDGVEHNNFPLPLRERDAAPATALLQARTGAAG